MTILHIVRNLVTQDSRVLKETRSIQQTGFYEAVEIAGFHEPGHLEEENLEGRIVRRFRLSTRPLPKDIFSQSIKYAEWYTRLVRYYRQQPLEVIHCHDLAPLPIAVRLRNLTGARLIYDAHELETETVGSHGVRKALARRTENRLIPCVDQMITVSPSIRDWYQDHFPGTPISLVRNIPQHPERHATPQPLREELGVPDDALLFIYLGGLGRGRGIELALEAFRDERVPHHVLFMGDGPLREAIQEAGKVCAQIHFRSPVPPAEVLDHAAGADVGLCLYEDTCLNHRYCLPNKLFESLLSGLPVLASDLPDQARIVREYQAGWVVSNDSGEIAKILAHLDLEQVQAIREGLKERIRGLCWENEEQALVTVYRELRGGG